MVEITKLISTLLLLMIMVLTEMSAIGLDESRVISANEILAKIEKGEPVNYTNIMIIGEIDLRGINPNISYSIRSPIKIDNAHIYGRVSFDDAIIQEQIDIKNSEFFELASFNGTQFLKDVNLRGSRFDRSVLFLGTQFNKNAIFLNSEFNGFANFQGAKFQGKGTEFSNSKFKDRANFNSGYFASEFINFEESKFFGPATFQDVVFDGSTSFMDAQFNDRVDFRFAQFNKLANFEGVNFSKEVNFNWIKFGKLNIRWDSLMEKLDCNGPVYMDLIKNFRDLEQFDDADSCYYQYRDWRRVNRPLEWAKITDYVAWLSCGYGVRWQYTIVSGLVMIALFGVYFEFNYLARTTVNILLKRNAQSRNSSISDLWRSIKKSLSFSTMTLLSLPSDWFPYGKEEYSKSVKSHLYAAILERLIGWGLMLLLIGTLTRLMVRY